VRMTVSAWTLCAVFQKELDTPGESSLEAGKFSGPLACANEAPGA
jgi:hypothetical protein